MIRVLLLILLSTKLALAASWYAAPASWGGNGSITNPWNIYVAFTNTGKILPGDTLNLRGGTYQTPSIFSTLSGYSTNYVTVQSYPGEWAIITDGGSSVLETNLTSSAADIHWPLGSYITGGTNWVPGTVFMVQTGTNIEAIKFYSVANGWVRGWGGTTITNHNVGDPVMLADDFIYHTGSYVTFRDFEITSANTTNRILDAEGYTVLNWRGSGLNLQAPGTGNKAIGLIVHNVGHPGIGFWEQGEGGEINGCLIWGNGYYDVSIHYNEPRGAGIYTQNGVPGNPIIKNSIIFDNITEGIHAYGAAGMVNGYRMIGNMFTGNANVEGAFIGTASLNPMTNNYVWTNYFGANSLTFGYITRTNSDLQSIGNIFAKTPGFDVSHTVSGVVSNNTYFWDQTPFIGTSLIAFSCPETNQTNISFTWDLNHYYVTNTQPYLFAFSTHDVTAKAADGSGGTKWVDGTNSWTSWTHWDSNSTYQAGWPNNYLNVAVEQMDYDTNLYHVCVISSYGATNATVNLGTYGVPLGYTYGIIDAQNWPIVVKSGTYAGGTVSLPLTLTNIASIPAVTNFVPTHSNVANPGLFNQFLVQITPPPPTATINQKNVGNATFY